MYQPIPLDRSNALLILVFLSVDVLSNCYMCFDILVIDILLLRSVQR